MGKDPADVRKGRRASRRRHLGKVLHSTRAVVGGREPATLGPPQPGTAGITAEALRALLNRYDVTDTDVVDELVNPADIPTDDDLLGQTMLTFLEYEASAAVIRQFEPMLVPGILQVRAYTQALLARPIGSGTRSAFAVETYLRRPRIIDMPDPPRMYFILDEAVVHRQVGGPAVMRAQLNHLKELAELPNITIEIVPFAAGAYPGLRCPFAILEFADESLPNLLYVQGTLPDHISTNSNDIGPYLEIFGRLRTDRRCRPFAVDRPRNAGG